MKKWIEKIRKKSEPEKKRYAIVGSAFITLFIAFIYFFTLIHTTEPEISQTANSNDSFKNIFQVLE
jgi:hypothetical protein